MESSGYASFEKEALLIQADEHVGFEDHAAGHFSEGKEGSSALVGACGTSCQKIEERGIHGNPQLQTAIDAAREELVEIEHCMQVWLQQARDAIGGVRSSDSLETLHTLGKEVKESPQTEELLRLMAVFPASLDFYVSARLEKQATPSARLCMRRSQMILGGGHPGVAKITTDWASYVCKLRGRVLELYADSTLADAGKEPVVLIELEKFYCIFAGADGAGDACSPSKGALPGLRELQLIPVQSKLSYLASLGASLPLFGGLMSFGGMLRRGNEGGDHDDGYMLRAGDAEEARLWINTLTPLCAHKPDSAAAEVLEAVRQVEDSHADCKIGTPMLHEHPVVQPHRECGVMEPDEVAGFDVWTVLTRLSDEGLLPAHAHILTARLRVIHGEAPEEVEFYLPQLCNLLLEGTSTCADDIEGFLFDTCGGNIHFASLVVWNLQAAVDAIEHTEAHQRGDRRSPPVLSHHMLQLRDVCGRIRLGVELAVVDGKHLGVQEAPEAFLHRVCAQLGRERELCKELYGFQLDGVSKPTDESPSPSAQWDLVREERERRRVFFYRLQTFVRDLCALSSALKARPKGSSRDDMLREKLLELNAGLPDGVYVPFGASSERQRVVCALPLKHAFCLSTYDKAPYVVCVETIALLHTRQHSDMIVHSSDILRHSLSVLGIAVKSEHEAPLEETGMVLVNMPDYPTLANALPLTVESQRLRVCAWVAAGMIAGGALAHGSLSVGSLGSGTRKAGLRATGAVGHTENGEHEGEVKHDADKGEGNVQEAGGNAGGDWTVGKVGVESNVISAESHVISAESHVIVDESHVIGDESHVIRDDKDKAHAGPQADESVCLNTNNDRDTEALHGSRDGRANAKHHSEVPTSMQDARERADVAQPREGQSEKSRREIEPKSPTQQHSPHRLASDDSTASSGLLTVEGKRTRVLNQAFGEPWDKRTNRIRSESPFGAHPDWGLSALIVKAFDDLRQEQFVMQLICQFKKVWDAERLPLQLRPYGILATSYDAGLIEVIPDSVSLAALRKKHPNYTTLSAFFREAFGDEAEPTFRAAQSNFVSSMAAYSVVCYLLQIKDRHDGNIMLLRDGSVVHIDFGYVLGRRMNEVVQFETAPFKLTHEHVEVMGGAKGPAYQQYLALCIRGFLCARKHAHKFVALVKTMQAGSTLPCLEGGQLVLTQLLERFGQGLSDRECVDLFIRLREEALKSWRTGAYDMLQKVLGVN